MARTKQIDGKTYKLYGLEPYTTKRDALRSADEIRRCGYYVRVVRGRASESGRMGWILWMRRMG